jgi:hypothetical protein
MNLVSKTPIDDQDKILLRTIMKSIFTADNHMKLQRIIYSPEAFEKYKMGVTKNNSVVILKHTEGDSKFPYKAIMYSTSTNVNTFSIQWYSKNGRTWNLNADINTPLDVMDIEFVIRPGKVFIKHIELS